MKYKDIRCKTTCPFFPDMSIEPGQWKWDENLPYIKRRLEEKTFRCGYDGHVLDWALACPREVDRYAIKKAN